VIDIQICGSETPKHGSKLHFGLAEAKESNSYELLKQTVTFSKIELHIFQIFTSIIFVHWFHGFSQMIKLTDPF
jgi:hypothetical protein